ncbi:Non-Catalytic module family expansin [Apiospora phragmitis]|uniref:Non-Catalytic module family expansin n=1 Tax=Apiospora phragmitis TaxID=2905665 RepID=A0ABR1VFA0_9PEZI
MKSATFATALLASVAIAQPHGHARHHHHEKRDLVVDWTTEWVTETVWVDDLPASTAAPTTTAAPAAKPTTSKAPAAQFFEPPQQPSPSVPEVKPTTEAVKPVETSPEPVPAPVTTNPLPPVVAPTTLIPAPKPSTVAPPPPPPAPTVVAPPPPVQSTTQAAPAPAPSAPSSGGGSSSAEKFTGDITYYQPGMGSCGYDDSALKGNVVAVSKAWFMSVGNGKTSYGVDQPANILCDKTITISAKGKTTQATIRDSCPGCAPGSIDVTEGAFKDLFGSLDVGRSEVTWWLNEPVAGA